MVNNHHEYFIHNAQKVVTEAGLEYASKTTFSFQPDYQSISLHKIMIHRADQIIDILPSADIQLIRPEKEISSNIYNGTVDLVIVIPEVRVGDVLEYAATIHGKNPVFGHKNFATFSTGWQVPVAENHIRVLSDHTKQLKTKVHNSDLTISVNNRKHDIEYTWHQKNTPIVVDEQEFPASANPYPYIEFSEYSSWSEVVSWASELYATDHHTSTELKNYVKELKARSSSTKEYIEQAIQFVQNDIRYFGIELGINSHLPSAPDTVFQRRYGDCKDKTVLLNYLLSHADIKAYPALVSSNNGQAITQHLPSPGSFDHVISYFEFDGNTYWIDGTRSLQYGTLENIGISNFYHALLIKTDEQQLVNVKLNDKHKSLIQVNEEFIANKDYQQPVTLNVTIKFSSHEAEYMRSVVANSTLAELSASYLGFYGQHFPEIKAAGNLEVNDDKERNQLTIVGKYSIPHYWSLAGEALHTDFFGDFISPYVELPKTIDRKLPLSLYHPIEISHQASFLFPEEIDWQLDYSPLVIADNAIHYKRQISKNGAKLTTSHVYRSQNNIVNVDDVKAHINNLKEIRKALYFSVVSENKLKKPTIKKVLRGLLKKRKPKTE